MEKSSADQNHFDTNENHYFHSEKSIEHYPPYHQQTQGKIIIVLASSHAVDVAVFDRWRRLQIQRLKGRSGRLAQRRWCMSPPTSEPPEPAPEILGSITLAFDQRWPCFLAICCG